MQLKNGSRGNAGSFEGICGKWAGWPFIAVAIMRSDIVHSGPVAELGASRWSCCSYIVVNIIFHPMVAMGKICSTLSMPVQIKNHHIFDSACFCT